MQIDGAVRNLEPEQRPVGQLDLDPAAQRAGGAPRIDVPFVAVPRQPGADDRKRYNAPPGREILANLGARLLQNAKAIELARVLLGKFIRAADVQILVRSPSHTNRDASSRSENARTGSVWTYRSRRRNALDGKRDAVLKVRLTWRRWLPADLCGGFGRKIVGERVRRQEQHGGDPKRPHACRR